MTLDATLNDLQRFGAIIVSPTELWGDVPPRTLYHFKRHTAHIAERLRLADISVCPSKDLHRRYWRYAGAGRYTCDKCQELLPFVSE